ncbi:DNA methyltransferase [Microcoleus sp. herbarium8]|uniref:DNA methyltransferase n=1 Tax=Microcoleus sp. herbarium8 TaxID=3055436 RepID=UPI002FD2E819
MVNQLFYGDNLDVLRRHIKDESVDLCYIDPPFNSKRNYNQIYNNIGKEDQAQAQAFIDTWTWDDYANQGLAEILENYQGKFTLQSIDLIAGLTKVLSKGSLLAYLVHMTLRVAEIHRVLRLTGSFYLHCYSTVSHYLKLVLDAIFCPQGGDFINEIVWKRTNAHSDTKQGRKAYGNITDVILYYSKSKDYKFNTQFLAYTQDYVTSFYKHTDADGRRYQLDNLTGPGGEAKGNPYYEVMGVKRYWRYSQEKMNQLIAEGRVIQTKPGTVPRYKRYLDEMSGTPLQNIWDDIKPIQSQSAERLGYPTQKPLAILERIIQVSSDEGDVVLDAYCGCGTTVCASQRLNRQWIGIDITYQSISLILKRLEDSFGKGVLEQLKLNGIPKDMEAAVALANKKDDRTRKEFEKWAVLTYTNNRATINAKKGADKRIDGIAYFQGDKDEPEKIIVQVKSGKMQSGDIRDLQGTITLEQAALGIFISLKEPTKDMIRTAKSAGIYQSRYMNQSSDKIQIVTIKEMLEQKKRLDVRLSFEVVKSAEKQMEVKSKQLELDI